MTRGKGRKDKRKKCRGRNRVEAGADSLVRHGLRAGQTEDYRGNESQSRGRWAIRAILG